LRTDPEIWEIDNPGQGDNLFKRKEKEKWNHLYYSESSEPLLFI